MKKFLAIIALAGVFTACGGGSDTESTTDSTSMMQSAPTTDTGTGTMGTMGDTSSATMGGTSDTAGGTGTGTGDTTTPR